MLFADDFVLLASFESGLQHAFIDFASACDSAGIKISTSKTVILHFSRNPVKYSLQVGGITLKQVDKLKYLGVAWTSDGRQDEELVVRLGKASGVMRALQHLVVLKDSYQECKTLGI